jgi:hypothetical protein
MTPCTTTRTCHSCIASWPCNAMLLLHCYNLCRQPNAGRTHADTSECGAWCYLADARGKGQALWGVWLFRLVRGGRGHLRQPAPKCWLHHGLQVHPLSVSSRCQDAAGASLPSGGHPSDPDHWGSYRLTFIPHQCSPQVSANPLSALCQSDSKPV